jgi:uncharacterized protein YerC
LLFIGLLDSCFIHPTQALETMLKLSKTFLALRTQEEVDRFLMTIMSSKEIKMLELRWKAVQLALQGSTQRKIRDSLKTSIASASRAARSAHASSKTVSAIVKRLTDSK